MINKIHIGLALLAMKKVCEREDVCTRCPLYCFCGADNTLESPSDWTNDMFPNLIVPLDIKNKK